MALVINEFFKRLFTGIILLICVGGAYLHSATLFALCLTAVLMLILTFEWPLLAPKNKPLFLLLSLIYPIAPFFILISLTLRYYSTDIYLPLHPFFVAWTADTCGYAIGKLWGFHKIWPVISPQKSWEGLAGSVVGVFIMHLLLLGRITTFSSAFFANNIFMLFLFSVVTTIIAFAGGLFFSYLKRKRNLKDAGNVLPGHGGFLDRFDGVVFVAPITFLLALIYG